MAAWFGGAHKKHKNLGIWVSLHLESKWRAPVEAISARCMLNVAVPIDGKDWNLVVPRERTPNFENPSRCVEYSYPAVIPTKDGMIHISYTCDCEGIKHVILDTRKL